MARWAIELNGVGEVAAIALTDGVGIDRNNGEIDRIGRSPMFVGVVIKDLADAIKVAREMALIPYATRVTTQRSNRGDRGDRGPRGPRRDDRATEEASGETTDNAEAVAEVEGVEFNAADTEGAE